MLHLTKTSPWIRRLYNFDPFDSENQQQPGANPQTTPRLLRRFPSLKSRQGMQSMNTRRNPNHPLVQFNKMMDCCKRNPHLLEQGKINVLTKNSWQTMIPTLTSLPTVIQKILRPERGYMAKLLKSPDRVMGITDVSRGSERIRQFTFIYNIYRGYTNDWRILIFITLLLGFNVWFFFCIPEPLFVRPDLCYSEVWPRLVKEALSSDWEGGCPFRHLAGYHCIHPEAIHDQVMIMLEKSKEAFDPLNINPQPKSLSFGHFSLVRFN